MRSESIRREIKSLGIAIKKKMLLLELKKVELQEAKDDLEKCEIRMREMAEIASFETKKAASNPKSRRRS